MNGLLEIGKSKETQLCGSSEWDPPNSPKVTESPQELTRSELQQELSRLMGEQIRSLEWQSFMGIDVVEVQRQEKRLQRIREISGELILAIRKTRSEPEAPTTDRQTDCRAAKLTFNA